MPLVTLTRSISYSKSFQGPVFSWPVDPLILDWNELVKQTERRAKFEKTSD